MSSASQIAKGVHLATGGSGETEAFQGRHTRAMSAVSQFGQLSVSQFGQLLVSQLLDAEMMN